MQKYSKEILNAFFSYWTDNQSKTNALRTKKTFDINLRLSDWASKGKLSGQYPTIIKN
jgi:hypothetical protein